MLDEAEWAIVWPLYIETINSLKKAHESKEYIGACESADRALNVALERITGEKNEYPHACVRHRHRIASRGRPCALCTKVLRTPEASKCFECGWLVAGVGKQSRLEIDGKDVPFSVIWVHRQDEPHPGDHRYRMAVPRQWLDRWLTEQGKALCDLSDAGIWFYAMIEFGPAEGCWLSLPAEYVLNTVDRIERGEDYVVFSGVCSTFIRNLTRS